MRKIDVKKLIVKIGTNVIAKTDGTLDIRLMKKLVGQVAALRKDSRDVIIITSGAIGAGMKELNIKTRPKDTTMRQVCAAIGQSALMSNYRNFFSKYKINIAQILLTYKDFLDRNTFLNLHNSINTLMGLGVIPIINENDPIATDEIKNSFGDNDVLSALVASKMGADLLVILTNVNGLYDKNPNNRNAVLINKIAKIDKKIISMGGKANHLGLGGMKSKINAARIATKSGVDVIIANGRETDILSRILNGQNVGTLFVKNKNAKSL